MHTQNHGNAYPAHNVNIVTYWTIIGHFYDEIYILWLIKFTYFMVYIFKSTCEKIILFGV